MDPKMDTGLWQPGDDALFNPHQAIELGQTLGIIDKIACQEAAWLNGHSLAQTLLTCRYLKDLPKCRNSPMACLSQQVLYDYLWALIACLRLVHDEVRKGNIFEEEDFHTNLYDSPLLLRVGLEDQLVGLLEESLTSLRALSTSPVVEALIERLEFRRNYLKVLNACLPQLVNGNEAHLKEATRLIQLALASIPKEFSNTVENVDFAFNWRIQSHLPSFSPPRPIVHLSYSEAMAGFKSMFSALLDIFKVLAKIRPTVLEAFVEQFSKNRFIAHQPFVRSFFMSIQAENELCPDYIRTLIGQFSRTPEEYLPKNGSLENMNGFQDVCGDFENLIENVSKLMVDTTRAACQNHCRKRRLYSKYLSDWDILQCEAEGLDSLIQEKLARVKKFKNIPEKPFFASSWIYYTKIKLIVDVLFSGFELELYHPREFDLVYWYAGCTCERQDAHLTRVITNCQKPLNQELLLELTFYKALKYLCLGYFMLLRALKLLGTWTPGSGLLEDVNIRFAQRFRHFSSLGSPLPLRLEGYLDECTRIDRLKAGELLGKVKEILNAAKSKLGDLIACYALTSPLKDVEVLTGFRVQEFQGLLKACNSAIITANLALGKDNWQVIPGQHHPWFTSFRINKKK